MIGDEDDDLPSSASPPCFMHEVDPSYVGMVETINPGQQANVARWRTAERERLIKARLSMPSDVRRAQGLRIAAQLEEVIGNAAGLTVSAYWPFRGEPDLRPLVECVAKQGGRMALPVVVRRGAPMIFRVWEPGGALEKGVWNIPVPPRSAEEIIPDIVVAPVVGFDPACYRLGYGGGFFDRTLAALSRRPRVLGVGYSQAAIRTIYPQPHDIALDLVITEEGITTPSTDVHQSQ